MRAGRDWEPVKRLGHKCRDVRASKQMSLTAALSRLQTVEEVNRSLKETLANEERMIKIV